MIEIRPITQATGDDNPERQISVNAWNLGHQLTASPDVLIGTDGTGAAKEYPVDAFVTETELDDAIGAIPAPDLTGYAKLAGGNAFTGDQSIEGNLVVTGQSVELGSDAVAGVQSQVTYLTGTDHLTKWYDFNGNVASLYVTNTRMQWNAPKHEWRGLNGADIFGSIDITGLSVNGKVTLLNEAYGPAWAAKSEAPTKQALYAKIETLGSGGGGDVYLASNNYFTGMNNNFNGLFTVGEEYASVLGKYGAAVLAFQQEEFAYPIATIHAGGPPADDALHYEANNHKWFNRTEAAQMAALTSSGLVVSGRVGCTNEVYGATWAAKSEAPTKMAVYAKIESMGSGGAVSDIAFAASWDAVTAIAPSKNAVYDKFVLVDAAIAGKQPTGNYSLVGHTHVITDVTGLQAALDAKADDTDLAGYIPVSQKGAAGGVPPLDGGSKIPAAYLPSYVDDVIEVANFAALPSPGETGKIYVTLDTNAQYRWSGSAYVKLSDDAGAAVWGAITGSLPAQLDLKAALDAKAPLVHVHAISDVTGLQPALDGKQPVGSYSLVGHTHTIAEVTGLQLALDNLSTSKANLAGGNTWSGAQAFGGAITVPDDPYAAGWDGNMQVPTKNAVYDKIQALSVGGGGVTTFNTRSGAVVLTSADVTTALTFTPANKAGDTFAGAVLVPDDAYSVGWDGKLEVPTKNAVYDKIQAVIATIPAAPSSVISDTVYGAGWNGVAGIAPSQNAVYDKIELLNTAITGKADASALAGYLPLAGGIVTGDTSLRGETNHIGPPTVSGNANVYFDTGSFGYVNYDTYSSGSSVRAGSMTWGSFGVEWRWASHTFKNASGATQAQISDGGIDIPAGRVFSIGGVAIGGGAPDDTAYSSAWDAVTTIAPSKNAVYDQMELKANISALANYLPLTGGTLTGALTATGSGNANGIVNIQPVGTGVYAMLNMKGIGGAQASGLAILAGNTNAYFNADTFTLRNAGSTSNYLVLTSALATFINPIVIPDDAYAAGWNGSFQVPTKNAVYDKIEAVIATIPAAPSTVISDTVYGAGWNGVTGVAPSQNAVYDKIELLAATIPGAGVTTFNTRSGAVTLSVADVTAAFPAQTGDVTNVAGAVATTIAAKAVTLAKMADVATGTVFYRKTAATGVPEVQPLATLKTDLGLTGTNSGDQTTIVGITGTLAQFNTAITDADIMPIAGGTFTGAISVPADAYAAGWNGSLVVPTKDAVYDKIEALAATIPGAGVVTFNTRSGAVTLTAADVTAALPAMTGDVTAAAGSNVTTIAANVVGFSKFVAAPSAGIVWATAAGNYGHNASGGGTANFLRADGTWAAPAGTGVTTFNTRSGAVTLTSGDVTTALGFSPSPLAHTHWYSDVVNVPTGTVAYRKTAGTGELEMQTLATLRADLQPPLVSTSTTAATITPVATEDGTTRTTQTVNLTINAPTGTAVNMFGHVLRIKATAAIATVTWNAIYRAIGVVLPTSMVSGKTTYIGMIYNSLDTKWDVVSVATEA